MYNLFKINKETMMKDKIQRLIDSGNHTLANVLIVGQGYDESDFKWSLRGRALNFVERNGPSTWTEIQGYMLGLKGMKQSRDTRGWYSSYFHVPDPKKQWLAYSWGYTPVGLLMKPSSNDSRYLQKRGKLYHLITN